LVRLGRFARNIPGNNFQAVLLPLSPFGFHFVRDQLLGRCGEMTLAEKN
jgi:hypothetical protein